MSNLCKYCGEYIGMGHDHTCPLRDPEATIDRLNRELARLVINSAEMMQNQSNGMLKLMEENRSLERQLAEAVDANKSMHNMIMQIREHFNAWDTPTAPTDKDIVSCVIRNSNKQLAEAREEVARECLEIVDNNYYSEKVEPNRCSIDEIKTRFKLEESND